MVKESTVFKVSTAAEAKLIGTTFAVGGAPTDDAPELDGDVKRIAIRTHEHYGDVWERLDFPAAWDVQVQNMAGHDAPVLGHEEIRGRLHSPIGTARLSELAQGKRSAVITFDDLTRPTPISAVAPVVVEELLAAGIPSDRIVFLAACGTHRNLEQDEVVRKLGIEQLQDLTWINHNPWDNLQEVGTTSAGNVVRINRTFAASDLRITLSGVKFHGFAGYGGGAKSIVPGIAGFDTVNYNHTVLMKKLKSSPRPGRDVIRVYHNDIRADMEEAARLAKVDFSVQIVYNGERRVSAIFAGDIVEAFRAASRFAVGHYHTDVVAAPDVVVCNSYPQATQAKTNTWTDSVREGGTAVLIIQHPQGISAMHYWGEHMQGQAGGSHFDVLGAAKTPLPGGRRLIVFSQYSDKRLRARFPDGTFFTRNWFEVIEQIKSHHESKIRVAVYPYAAIQHAQSRLDGPDEVPAP
jgi:nickel-dependent lactate racemase